MPKLDQPWYTDMPGLSVVEPSDRWRCSLCGGYVRGNAPRCKHCHALFPNTPSSSEEHVAFDHTVHVRASSFPRWLIIAVMYLVLGVIIYGSWRIGVDRGGFPGALAGWTLGGTLATLLFAAWTFWNQPHLWQPRRLMVDVAGAVAFVQVACIFPILTMIAVAYASDAWWDKALGIMVGVTLFMLIVLGLTRCDPAPDISVTEKVATTLTPDMAHSPL